MWLRIAAVTMLAALQAIPRPASRQLVDEVGALADARDNDGRFAALSGLLDGHGIAHRVEPFTIEKALDAEPRTAGRNIVATLGAGPRAIVVGAHYDAVRLPDGSLSHG